MAVNAIDDRLLAAAAEVFAERGYDGAGVAEIARRAGVTTGAIYSRYRGKAELLVDALDVAMASHLETVLATSGARDVTGVLAALGTHLLSADSHGSDGLLVEAVVATRREPELAAMLERRLADERARLGKVIEAGKADGLFDPDLDGEAVVTFIQSIGLGFVLFRTIGTPMPDADAWQVVIDRVITAARPAPNQTAPSQTAPASAGESPGVPKT
ncbi:MAG: TetR/AcrR family transcriptional regulator [Acidimicrobiales bacterium]